MRSKLGMPSSLQHTASPSMIHERERQAGERLDDQWEAVGQVVAGAAVEPHSRSVLTGNDTKPSCLISCNQAPPERGFGALVGRHGAIKPDGRVRVRGDIDPPPLKWSDLRYVFDIQEDCNGKEAIQA
jgi:hypothetical protein